MGTCLDWHSTIVSALPSSLSTSQKSTFALELRQAYFDYNAQRIRKGKPVEEFDTTQRRVLESFLNHDQNTDIKHLFTSDIEDEIVAAWHRQKAWPEVRDAINRLKNDRKLQTYVHANGSTRLQLDLVESAGLKFDMLFSSELLGVYKPAPECYQKAMEFIKLRPDECVMVAAHTSDLKGAKAVGMRTVYIYRWTDDIREDQEEIKTENDAYLEDMSRLDTVIGAFR